MHTRKPLHVVRSPLQALQTSSRQHLSVSSVWGWPHIACAFTGALVPVTHCSVLTQLPGKVTKDSALSLSGALVP